MKKYYLETNAVRNLSKYLETDFVKENCFTSHHTLVELLTDIKETDFEVRKTVIRRVLNNLEIDWRQAQRVQFDAFNIPALYNITEEKIRDISSLLMSSESVSDFATLLDKRGLSSEYKMLENLDASYNTYFPDEMKNKNSEFRAEYDFKTGKQIGDNLLDVVDVASQNFNSSLQNDWILVTALKIAKDIADSKFNSKKKNMFEIFAGYNPDIDAFLFASSIYALQKVSDNQTVARNDFTDLYHCIYLSNEVILVTNDNLLIKVLNKYQVGKAEKCDEFIRRLTT